MNSRTLEMPSVINAEPDHIIGRETAVLVRTVLSSRHLHLRDRQRAHQLVLLRARRRHNAGRIAGVLLLGCCALVVAANGTPNARCLSPLAPIRSRAYFALRVTECLTLCCRAVTS